MLQVTTKENLDLQTTYFDLKLENLGQENPEVLSCKVKGAPRMMAIVRALNAEARREGFRVYKVMGDPGKYYLRYAHSQWGEEDKSPVYVLTVGIT